MEHRSSTHKVTIKDKVYEINKLDARSGCWLFAFVSDRSGDGPITSGLGKCSLKEFTEVQTLVLQGVFYLDSKDGTTFPIAVVGPGGSLIGEVGQDVELAFKLTIESIVFNISPFLVVKGSSSQK